MSDIFPSNLPLCEIKALVRTGFLGVNYANTKEEKRQCLAELKLLRAELKDRDREDIWFDASNEFIAELLEKC